MSYEEPKLQTDLAYIARCSNCGHDTRYTLRASNVNSSITDKDARSIAIRLVGTTRADVCEQCEMVVELKIVAYDLPEAPNQEGETVSERL